MQSFYGLACAGSQMARNLLAGLFGIDLVYSVSQIRQSVPSCVLSCIPQLLVESAPGQPVNAQSCDSPELRGCVCRVLCIRASLYTNPLNGQAHNVCHIYIHLHARTPHYIN